MRTEPSARKAALAVSCTAHIVQDGLTTTINVLLPVLAQVLGLSYAQVGLLKGLNSLSQAVLEMCSGWFSERLGECQLIFVGLVLSAAGYMLLSIAPGAILVTISLLVVGAGTALHHAPSSALVVANYRSDRRSGALGLYNASGDIGKLVFTGCFSLATGAGLAWSQISLFYGLVAILAAIAIVIATGTLRRRRQEQARSENANGDQTAVAGWGILNWRLFGALLAVISIDNMVQTSVLVFVAFLMLAKGLPLWFATAATVMLLAGGVFGKAGCGFLADRIGVRPAFVLIQLLAASGLVVVAIAPSWFAMAVLLPLGAVVQGSTSITYGVAANLIHPRRMARGYALLYSSGSFTAAAGPPVFGMIADGLGIELAIYAMAIATLLTAPLIFVLPGALKDTATPAPERLLL
ncbi:MAG: MFS transporter [Rhizobiaceae bacterium]